MISRKEDILGGHSGSTDMSERLRTDSKPQTESVPRDPLTWKGPAYVQRKRAWGKYRTEKAYVPGKAWRGWMGKAGEVKSRLGRAWKIPASLEGIPSTRPSHEASTRGPSLQSPGGCSAVCPLVRSFQSPFCVFLGSAQKPKHRIPVSQGTAWAEWKEADSIPSLSFGSWAQEQCTWKFIFCERRGI